MRHVKTGQGHILPLTPRLLSDDIVGLKQAAISGLGIVVLPGYTGPEDGVRASCAGFCPIGRQGLHPDRVFVMPSGAASLGSGFRRSPGNRNSKSGDVLSAA